MNPPAGLSHVVLASGNPGKFSEFRELLAPLGVELIAQSRLGIADAEETGLSFVENALLKARHASRASGLAALADDSGLCVDALNGAPGLYSARFAGAGASDAENLARLIAELAEVPDDRRSARFVCALALVRHPEDPDPLIARGEWNGRILRQPCGQGGFGYDPLFFDPELGLSAAQMSAEIKHGRSHRGQACRALTEQLFRLER